MEMLIVRLNISGNANLIPIPEQSHFIRTGEYLYEVVVNTVPGAKFGIAFNEASGPRLIRAEAPANK
jgi:adenosine/AMP kinase